MNIFFDVDLTVVSSGCDFRPHTREVLAALKAGGHRIYFWSMGGDEYTQRMVERYHLGDMVDGCFSKTDEPVIVPDFCVDDERHYVDTYGGHQVGRYLTGSARDRDMLLVLQRIQDMTKE